MTVTVQHRHLRELGYCNAGSRAFAARHGMDWRAFLRDGIPVESVEATGDAMAIRVANRARQEAHHGQRK